MTNQEVQNLTLNEHFPIPSHWDISKLKPDSLTYPTPADDFQECDENYNSLKLKTFSEEDFFFFIMNHKNVHPISIGMRIEGEKEEDNRILFFNWDDYPYMRDRWSTSEEQRKLYDAHKELVDAIEIDIRYNKDIKNMIKLINL